LHPLALSDLFFQLLVGGFELGGAFDDAAFKRLIEPPNFFLELVALKESRHFGHIPVSPPINIKFRHCVYSSSRRKLTAKGGCAERADNSTPRNQTKLSASICFRRGLVERRIGNLKGLHLWLSLHHFRQDFQYLRIHSPVVSLRILFSIPEAAIYSFRTCEGYRGGPIAESPLLDEQRDNLVLDDAGKLGLGIGPELHRDLTCIHS